MEIMRDLGSVSSKFERATEIRWALVKNYPLEEKFWMAKNNYNDGYNLYIKDVGDEIKVAEYRGFIRGVIVERQWLEPDWLLETPPQSA
jgi:hypothetical protein